MKAKKVGALTPEEFCPIRQTIRILGKRWTILIIKEVYHSKGMKLSFMDLRKRLEDVSAKVLSQRLREMTENDLLKRKANTNVIPIRVNYHLTEKGKDACDILKSLKKYGLKWGGKNTFDCDKIDCELCAKKREQQTKT